MTGGPCAWPFLSRTLTSDLTMAAIAEAAKALGLAIHDTVLPYVPQLKLAVLIAVPVLVLLYVLRDVIAAASIPALQVEATDCE